MRTVVATRAERQARTREDLLTAAERRFVTDGFHLTTLDAVAADAGYTKGAVYSNFASKEDLFFGVYERRTDAHVAAAEAVIAETPDPAAAIVELVARTAARRDQDDGWLAVFVEFWAHVLRHPEHRARFAEVHARAAAPLVAVSEDLAARSEAPRPLTPQELATVGFALSTGLGLERLTRPGAVRRDLAVEAQRLLLGIVTGGRS